MTTRSTSTMAAPDAGPVNDWRVLEGQTVRITKNGRVVRSGCVDAVTPAADVLWLEGHGAEPRTLFLKNDGFEVWLDSANPSSKQNGPVSGFTIDHVHANDDGELTILSVPVD